MSEAEGTLQTALSALRAHVDECMEFARQEERLNIVRMMRRDAELFSQCPNPSDCSHCHHAKAYIENFFDRNPELIKGENK